MKIEEALKVLDQASAMASGTRKDHVLIQEAIAIIRQFIEANTPKQE